MDTAIASFSTFRDYIQAHEDVLARSAVDLVKREYPAYAASLDNTGWDRVQRDIRYHLLYLADAVDSNSVFLFIEYLNWLKSLVSPNAVPNEVLVATLAMIGAKLAERPEVPKQEQALSFIEEGLDSFQRMQGGTKSYIREDQPLYDVARRYLGYLLQRDRQGAMNLVLDAVDRGVDIRDIYENVFQVTQWETGRLWQENMISVAQEHYCTAVTQLVMSRLYPQIFNQSKNGLVFVGTSVGDELHELGIRMISDFFELDGWDTFFLGANMPAESIVETVREEGADVLGISVTITYHLHKATKIIEGVRREAELPKVKILVGGYPFNKDPNLWKKIGADGYATGAREAIRKARSLVGADTE